MISTSKRRIVDSTRTLRERLGLTRSRHFTPDIASPWARLTLAFVLSVGGILVCTKHRDLVDADRFPLFGFACVILSAWLGRLLGGAVATAIWTLAGTYLFAAPVLSLRVARSEDVLALGVFALLGLAIGLLAESSHAAWRRGLRMADERQRLAEDLLQERNRLELLLANLPGIVFELKVEPDAWPPRVRYVSANAWRLTGYPPDQWRRGGLLWEELLPAEDRGAFEEAVRTAMRRGNAHHPHAWRHADGTRRSFESHLSSRPQRAEAEHVVHAVALDVTALELERDELLHATDLAREQAELATRAKDEFLAKVSHELRNPLNGILGWTQILADPASTDDELRRGIQLVDNSARTLARLVDDLLDFSRILSGKMALELSPTRLEPVISSACEEIRPAMNARGVELDCRVEEPLPALLGDATRLHQVLWNLLSNAAKFTPKGGRVELSARRDGSELRVDVRDDGAGIDAAFLPHVFAPFRQAEAGPARGHAGLGLGLSIVSQIIERHGGTVAAASDGPGRGSTFTIRLPIAPVESAAENVVASSRRRLDGVRVLVVDDDGVAREMLLAAIGRAGANVRAAGSAAEAYAELARFPPHVLVSDVEMPGEDGLSLLRRVRERSSEQGGAVPAVALTAHAQPADRRAALAAGFQEHLSKPVDTEALLAAVARLARGSREAVAPGAAEATFPR